MSVEDGREEKWATTVIRLRIPPKVAEAALQEYLDGIGKVLRSFEGYVSRKIVDVPSNDGRLLVSILKFKGATAEEAFEHMMRWNESRELLFWKRRGASIGVEFVEREMTTASVGRVDLQLRRQGAPPKWKMALVIELWVFLAVAFHAAAGTPHALDTGNEPFTLLVMLALVVPVLSYAALPLTLSVGWVSRWVSRRSQRPGDCTAVLEDGLMLFSGDEVESEVRSLEYRLEALERRLATRAEDDLERVRREHEVKNLGDDQANDPSGSGDESGGITVAARHHVRWDALDAFQVWCDDVEATMHKYDGFLGSDVFRPNDSELTFVAIFRFETLGTMETWLASDDRARLLSLLEPLVDASSVYAALGHQLRLLAVPSPSAPNSNLFGDLLFSEAAKKPPSPPVYKVCILTIVGLFLVTWPISAHLNPILAGLHPLLAILISTTITVVAATYFGAPFMLFFFSSWLRKLPPHPPGTDPHWLSHLKKFLVVGPKNNLTMATILAVYFTALLLAALLRG